MPSRPRSQKLWTLTLRSAKTSGVGSVSESKTLITPRFSATNTRPSDAKRTTVGLVSPLKTVDSEKPDTGAACAAVGVASTKIPDATSKTKLSHRAFSLPRDGLDPAGSVNRFIEPARIPPPAAPKGIMIVRPPREDHHGPDG